MPDKPYKPDVSFSLLENGLDFVLSAVEHLRATPSKRQLKYAILHLYSGTVLILKKRLSFEDWTYLFADPEKADEKIYETGEFHGPNLEQCLERLEKIDAEISEEHKRQLRLLSKKRRHLEHFHFTDTTEAITALTADILSFLVDFISTELDMDALEDEDAKILDKIRGGLKEFRAFVDSRWKIIEVELKSAGTVATCPTCLEHAWVIEEGASCKFCGHRVEDSASAAEQYITGVLGEDHYITEKDGGVWPRYQCPECKQETLVDLEYTERGPRYICFDCGATFDPEDISECSSCGRKKGDNDMAICDDCFRTAVSKDD